MGTALWKMTSYGISAKKMKESFPFYSFSNKVKVIKSVKKGERVFCDRVDAAVIKGTIT